jgi:hypothetical protein
MKRNLFTLIILFFVTVSWSQTYKENALDGHVMFKLKDSFPVDGENVKPLADASITNKVVKLEDYPQLYDVLSKYNITKIQRPSYYT